MMVKVNGPRYKWYFGVMIWITVLTSSQRYVFLKDIYYSYALTSIILVLLQTPCFVLVSMHTVFLPSTSLRIKIIYPYDESGQQQDNVDYVTSFVRSDRKVWRWREEDNDLLSGINNEFQWV
jgi:hypothetical protein